MPDKKHTAARYDDCPCRCCKKDDLCNKKPAECKPYKTWFVTKLSPEKGGSKAG